MKNYDFDINEAKNFDIYEVLMWKDLQTRHLPVTDIIAEDIIDIIQHINRINMDDKDIPIEERKPIIITITSRGGSVDVGYALIDAILNSKTPVYTVVSGYAYSMGFLIALAGQKRFTYANAKYLLHDGSSFAWDSTTKIQDMIQFQKRSEERSKEYILQHSKITSEQYDENLRVEWYMFADEAKELGVVDYIIGEDCDIDEVM